MKWDAGIGLRMMIMKAVGRLDVAVGEEGVGFTPWWDILSNLPCILL
jgi:hypothetical protein